MWSYDKYKQWLRARLIEIKNTLDFQAYDIEVFNEQDYAKQRSIKPRTITVITKFLSSNLIFQAKTQPIQMIIFTEENSMSVANSIITKFCEDWNFRVVIDGTTYTKQMYSTPVVLSNFQMIGSGQRTVFYVSATLFILEDVMDIENLRVKLDFSTATQYSTTATYNVGDLVYKASDYHKIYRAKYETTNYQNTWIDDEWEVVCEDDSVYQKVECLSATIGYTMSGDTQAFDGGFARTEKQFATFVLTVNVACVKNEFTNYCARIMSGTSNQKGNESFDFNFNIGDIPFGTYAMKLTGCTLTTAINNTPSLQLSFSV